MKAHQDNCMKFYPKGMSVNSLKAIFEKFD